MTSIKEIGTVEVNGVLFSYLEQGTGPLVLCLHGFPDHALSFRHLIPDLAAAGYRVVAPYMRGYAPTRTPEGASYQSAVLGRDVAALIKALSPDNPALVFGHDWGAVSAYAAALAEPGRIHRLAVASVPYGPHFAAGLVSQYRQIRRSFYIWFFQLPVADEAVAAADFAFIRDLWRDWSPGWNLPEDDWKALCETLAAPGVVKSALAYYRHTFNPAFHRGEYAELQDKIFVASIDVPTMILHGAQDGCIGAEYLDGMEHSFTQGLEKVVIPNAGHFLHLEKPDEVSRALLRFFKS